ncbi:enoyl-CoA hydratase [Methylocystis sp. MJC1]|jgi:enoyl-CoA hydratase/carnithine racemase|uniref:enoyl-CoA hydratase n=1 Tax=Methylocystis sp. MJC1 TaxID=2654282 RepID=UPI0013EC5BD5|nr:enoyl-CoA hydratase [Methylocystis sp. MJC1]KAF2990722.1 Short-chain-enoyl-CoA hydratase [Methylocystis sp. MJC1]MBU6528678.1 enoyl-CoA hydratase [Methylocystis sp. MJC1]UZX11567.1 enoyl-CoA hydratase [Methylocystis sp. MJC1]
MTAEADSSEFVLLEEAGHVARLTLNKPASRNALSIAMLQALSERLDALEKRGDIRVVVLQAEGPAFCAGHDLKELTAHRNDPDGGREFFDETMRACSALMQKVVALPKPVIAAVDEMATAAGCQLVASCDLAVAGPNARFCTPGVDIGLFCSTPAVALSRNLAPKHALEMLLTGFPIGAEAALRIGLVNRVSQDGARTGARALAELVAAKSPEAIRFGKKAFYAQREKPLAEAYDLASAVMVENMLAADAKEGIAAFLEKRAAEWR